jgi:Mor family transcriptional regulator
MEGINEVFEELECILGTENANRLVDVYHGSNLYISEAIVIARKYREIREQFKNGTSYRELGIRYGYTERHIRRIIHHTRKRRP